MYVVKVFVYTDSVCVLSTTSLFLREVLEKFYGLLFFWHVFFCEKPIVGHLGVDSWYIEYYRAEYSFPLLLHSFVAIDVVYCSQPQPRVTGLLSLMQNVGLKCLESKEIISFTDFWKNMGTKQLWCVCAGKLRNSLVVTDSR